MFEGVAATGLFRVPPGILCQTQARNGTLRLEVGLLGGMLGRMGLSGCCLELGCQGLASVCGDLWCGRCVGVGIRVGQAFATKLRARCRQRFVMTAIEELQYRLKAAPGYWQGFAVKRIARRGS